ncbi:MAG TPA: DUF4258 domain-containing protein [Nanoarchaeota archaeon]|nr:DUF4258 domain-containing protein [Nanoarchaeota archaeon]
MITLILYSRHARERMAERGISSNEVRDAIRMGAKERRQGKVLHHYRHFTAVTTRTKGNYFVITVMPRR